MSVRKRLRKAPAETRVASRTGEARGPPPDDSAPTSMTKTFSATPRDIEQRWYIVDAEGQVLGRLATEIARVIRGKHKAIFTPHMDTGDNVIVINAEKVK